MSSKPGGRAFKSAVTFDEFYRDQHRPLLRLCFLSTLDSGAATDAAQEALTRAWQRWSQIEGTRPDAWLRTVALNLCRSRWRRLGRDVRLRRLEIDATHDQPQDVDLLNVLRDLPQRQREAVILHSFADMPVAECAASMQTSAGSVKQHLSRGRAGLERALSTPLEANS